MPESIPWALERTLKGPKGPEVRVGNKKSKKVSYFQLFKLVMIIVQNFRTDKVYKTVFFSANFGNVAPFHSKNLKLNV